MPSIFIPPQPADPRRLGFSPRRNIGAVQQRRRVVALKAVQGINAAGVPVAATAYPYLAPPVNLSGFDNFLLTLTATSAVSGTPSGVQLVVQCYDVSNQPVAAPNSPYTLTLFPGVTSGVLAVPILVQNFGDLVAVGIQAATPWTGGQLLLGIKAKG